MNEMTENGKRRYKLKEVCIRLAEGHPLYSDVPLSSPTAALDVMRKELSQYDREILCVVNLNNKLKPINFNIVSMGSINGSVAAIPNILKSGILSNAAGFLLLHNHPSGDVTPSREDIQTTRRCIEAGKIMDIPCLDHVIVGGGNSDYYSFRESGMVDFTNEKISMTAEQILRVNESNSTYKGGTETMPENGRKDDLLTDRQGPETPGTGRSNDQVRQGPGGTFPVQGRTGVHEDHDPQLGSGGQDSVGKLCAPRQGRP